MPRHEGNRSALRRAASAVKRLFSRGQMLDDSAPVVPEARRTQTRAPQQEPQTARITHRQTDIPLDVLDNIYTPSATSSKASFRSDGADHQRDQELVLARAGSEWNDEDRYTNKSGDPRIGTHRRQNEPEEARVEKD